MKVKVSLNSKEYDSKYDWDCFCQAGNSGIVFSKKGNYKTAFFEAFPDTPSCFIRGEGKTIEESEQDAWEQYQKIQSCEHEMERRGRTDGYAYCKHCTYSSKVFEPLTKCCKCGVKTSYAQDFRGKYYCKKHSRTKPKDPNRDPMFERSRKTFPRKKKKLYKRYAESMLRVAGYKGKIKVKNGYLSINFICDDMCITPGFNSREFKRKGESLLKALSKAKRLKNMLI